MNLSNIKACGEYWDAMPKCEGGRNCQSCGNVIYDFRGKSELEIAIQHAESDTKVCGIYDQALIQPGLLQRSKNKLHWFYASLIGFITLSATESSAALQKNPLVYENVIDRTTKRSVTKADTIPQQARIELKGRAVDSDRHPIIGATIFIDSDTGTVTDFEGNFTLDITNYAANNKGPFTVKCAYIGYKTVEINNVDLAAQGDILMFRLTEQEHVLTSFYVRPAPLYKRIWFRVRSIFQKK